MYADFKLLSDVNNDSHICCTFAIFFKSFRLLELDKLFNKAFISLNMHFVTLHVISPKDKIQTNCKQIIFVQKNNRINENRKTALDLFKN